MDGSPFLGELPSREIWVHVEQDRQKSFESRVVVEIFKAYGVMESVLRSRTKSVLAGVAGKNYTLDWFNRFGEHPVKFLAMRFHGTRKHRDFNTEMHSDKLRAKAREFEILRDLQDTYPDMPVALVTKYPDWATELVYHTQAHLVEFKDPGHRTVTGLEDCCVVGERLADFLRRYTWDPIRVIGEF